MKKEGDAKKSTSLCVETQSMTIIDTQATHCPKCNCQWRSEHILEHFLRRRSEGDPSYVDKTDEEIEEIAESYGCTADDPRYFNRLIGVELDWDHPQHYDGVSYWMCPSCKTTWNRWTKEEEEIPLK